MLLHESYFPHLNEGKEARLAQELEWRRVALERARDDGPVVRTSRLGALVKRLQAAYRGRRRKRVQT